MVHYTQDLSKNSNFKFLSKLNIFLFSCSISINSTSLDQVHTSRIESLITLSNGNLASGSLDETIKIWDVGEGKEICTLEGHKSKINALSLLNDRRFASADNDGKINIWDLNENKLIKT